MKLLRQLTNSVLLEDNNCFRFYVAKDIYERGDEDEIRMFHVPYSLPFDLYIGEDGQEIQKRLYQHGIHRLEDVLSQRVAVKRLLGKRVSLEELIRRIKGEEING
jgi:hypothetical protein